MDEILNLIESVSEGFPSYSYKEPSVEEDSVMNGHCSLYHEIFCKSNGTPRKTSCNISVSSLNY